MVEKTYPFRIGDIEALVIADEDQPIDEARFQRIFNGDDAQDIRDAFAQLVAPRFSRNGLYLKTPTQHILVDTGEGYHAKGHFVERLHAAGIRPEQIDLIIITHFHLDHFGGMMDESGALIFPQARVVVSRQEWAHWMRDEFLATMDEQRRQFLQQTFEPYVQARRLEMVDDGQEIVPGIRAVLMPGHTPGQMGLLITSGDAALLHIADTAHFPLQTQFINRVVRFDNDPEQAITTRRTVLERAADEQVMILAFHFPFPGLGYIARQNDVFDWQPLVETL
jgi:glyoxylase-like metal-dependent hydrolase (beta-lactamase superfamily II)